MASGAMISNVAHPILRSLAADGPMLPTLVDGLPNRAGWVFEPKWDGWRCLAGVEDGRVELRSRRGVDLAPYFSRCSPADPSSGAPVGHCD
jgi:ATP-dependent DNA ligase